jgi:hypothetical protein
MGSLISKPTALVVTPPVPAFLNGLGAFQSRELSGASYGPSGSFGKSRPLDAALQGWATSKGGAFNQFNTALICADYSGGCEDRTNKRIHWGGDGGHGSTACNGAFFYDVRDDGTGRPRGAYGVPGTFSALSDVPAAPVPPIWPDGRPNAAHTYLARGFCSTNNRHYKFGHLSAYTGGAGSAISRPAWCNPDSTSHWPTNTWNTFDPPSFSGSGEGDWVMVSPDSTKALYGILRDGSQPARFYNMVTAAWGTQVKLSNNPQWNGNHQTYVWDSIRNRALLITAGIGALMDVDWASEMVSNQARITRLGDLVGLDRNSQSVWFDPERFFLGNTANTKGVIWCYGGRNPQANMNDITEFDPVSFRAVRYSLSGQIPQQAQQSGGLYRGLMNRHVFIAEWRTVFFVTDMERGAYAVRLPAATEDTSSRVI